MLGGWEAGRLGGWEAGRLGGWEAGKLGSWEAGKLGGWKLGGWDAEKKIGYFFLHYDFLQRITNNYGFFSVICLLTSGCWMNSLLS